MAAQMSRKLSPEDVIYILQCSETDRVTAQRLGVSRQAVSNVRSGKAYARIAPQLPRRNAPEIPVYVKDGETCNDCNYWSGRGCAFGFPEPLKDLRFAQECSMNFIEKEIKSRGIDALKQALESEDDE